MKLKNFESYYTGELQEELNKLDGGLVAELELTCHIAPEQYDMFDQYGNQVGYIRMRYGEFSVSYLHCLGVEVMFASADDDNNDIGYCCINSDEHRILLLSEAINSINAYHESLKIVGYKDKIGYYLKINHLEYHYYTNNDALIKLYEYEQSNMSPDKVKQLNESGPVKSYRDCIRYLVIQHREYRGNKFDEDNGLYGLSEEHVKHEIEWFRDTIDGIPANVKFVNRLFNKTFDDFVELFKEFSKMGWNQLAF